MIAQAFLIRCDRCGKQRTVPGFARQDGLIIQEPGGWTRNRLAVVAPGQDPTENVCETCSAPPLIVAP